MCSKSPLFFLFVTLCLFLQTGNARGQESLLHKFTLGDMELAVLSLGWQDMQTSILKTASEDEKAAVDRAYPKGIIRNSQNVLLIRTKDATVLIDTGFPKTVRELYASLLRAGTSSEKVTHIVITHAHGDHIGGLILQGKAAFPNAKLLFPKAELEYWLDSANKNSSPKSSQAIFADMKKLLQLYKGRIFSFMPGSDLFADLPGIQPLDAGGHTPGHVGIVVTAQDKTFFFWADLLHAFDVQAEYPDIAAVYDMDPVAAARVRETFLNRARAEKWLVCGSHVPFVQPIVLKAD